MLLGAMAEYVEILFTPADFGTLPGRDLSDTVCVVFDVLRATSSMLTALANGAEAVIPVADLSEALAWRRRRPDVLLAGERDGVRIRAAQTGGVDFDLGNSPREYTAAKVAGRTIVSTTTNGTRALRACASASLTLAGAFLNLRAVAEAVVRAQPRRLVIVCSGTFEETAYEDMLAAGALVELLAAAWPEPPGSDAVTMARQLYAAQAHDLLGAMRWAKNGRKLLANPELREDVPFCLQRDTLSLVGVLDKDGFVRPWLTGGSDVSFSKPLREVCR